MSDFNKKKWIENALRRASYKYPPRSTAEALARVSRGRYKCNKCKGIFRPKEKQLDHILPVVEPSKGRTDWNEYIERLFPNLEGWQVLCIPCHQAKSEEENAVRREVKKEKGKRMSATYIAVDTETGGIGSDVSLLTVYIAVLDKNMEILDDLNLAIKPDNGVYNVTAEALAINKINLIEHDKIAITSGKAGELFREFLMKHSPNGSIKLLPLGHNVAFDMDKLYQHVLNKKEAQKYISYRVLDTGSTGNFLKAAGLIPEAISGGLGTYVEYYNVPKREAHEAKNDVLMTVDVMKAMIKQIS